MAITFITDQIGNEPDLITQVAHEPLIVRSLRGESIARINAPRRGWTHEALCKAALSLEFKTMNGAEAFLGTRWVGSTEV